MDSWSHLYAYFAMKDTLKIFHFEENLLNKVFNCVSTSGKHKLNKSCENKFKVIEFLETRNSFIMFASSELNG